MAVARAETGQTTHISQESRLFALPPLTEHSIVETQRIPTQRSERVLVPSDAVDNPYSLHDPNNWFVHQISKAFHEDSTISLWPETTEDGLITLSTNEKGSEAYKTFRERPLIQALSLAFDSREIGYVNGPSVEQCQILQQDLDDLGKKSSHRTPHLQGRISATYAQSALRRYNAEIHRIEEEGEGSILDHTKTQSEIEKLLRKLEMHGFTPFSRRVVDIEDIQGLIREEIAEMKSGPVTVFFAAD